MKKLEWSWELLDSGVCGSEYKNFYDESEDEIERFIEEVKSNEYRRVLTMYFTEVTRLV